MEHLQVLVAVTTAEGTGSKLPLTFNKMYPVLEDIVGGESIIV